MGNLKSDQKNARKYGLKLSKSTDADIIEKLDSQPSVQGYIKALIRKDMKEDKPMKTYPKRISIDNGIHYVDPDEAIAAKPWNLIVSYMDDDTREAVHAEGYDTEIEFLTRYLELADADLIIG